MIILTGPRPARAGSLLILCLLQLHLLLPGSPTQAFQSESTDSTVQIGPLEDSLAVARTKFHSELESLASTCVEQNMPDQADIARRLVLDRDPNRQYIFMPPAFGDQVPADATGIQKSFFRRLTEIKKSYAAQLFEVAKAAATSNQGPESYQLMHEVLVYDPDHEATRLALGFRNHHELGWTRSAKPTRSAKARKRQKTIGWSKGTYWEINSPHFKIASAAGEEAGLKVAQELELTYWVWRQVFFDYWCTSRQLNQWLEGKSKDKSSSRQYTVILFRDRQHYLTELAGEKGIEISSGYYDERRKASFFYPDAISPIATWRHESVHQFLQENAGSNKTVADRGHAWMVEGIAMYFESMKLFNQHKMITLGGFDTERLQYARLRTKREGFFMPLQELDAMSREALQTHPKIRAIYSQASGVSQFLFTADNGKFRNGFVNFIKEFYKAKKFKGQLERSTTELSQIDRMYQQFLLVTAEELNGPFFDKRTTALALGRAGLQDADIQILRQCNNVDWLELSENGITDAGLECLSEMSQITQLFLDVTRITNAATPTIAKLKTLQELDLASTRISDAGIVALKDLPELQILWLAGSQVSDNCIEDLAKIPKLNLVDLRKTKVTDAGIEKLQELLPDGARIMH